MKEITTAQPKAICKKCGCQDWGHSEDPKIAECWDCGEERIL